MQERTDDRSVGNRLRYRTLVFAAFALVLAIVSALGVLDEFGQDFVAATTAESIGILLVSMGFDAGVSALQNVPVVGAGLDPINDAVERLSTVIVWAIGSLVLQRTALEIVSSAAFQWGFVAVCVVAVPLLLWLERRRSGSPAAPGVDRYRGWLVRLLVAAAMVRFFVPVFLAASATVSNVVLQPEIDEHRANLAALSAEIFGGEAAIPDEQPILDEQANGEGVAERRNAATADDEDSLAASGDAQDTQALPGNADAAESSPGSTDAAEPARGSADAAEPTSTDDESFLGGLLGGLSEAQDAALELFSGVNLPELPDDILPELPDLEAVRAIAGEVMELLSRLLVVIAIKNIALPLVFLWIAVKAAVPLAGWLIRLGTPDRRESSEVSAG